MVKSKKCELDYFNIEGKYGGNQSWFVRPMMKLCGCGAATACDLSIYLAKYKNLESLYPFPINSLSKKKYREFSNIMSPFLSPRPSGINTLKIFIDGFSEYLRQRKVTNLELKPLSGASSYETSKVIVRDQIHGGMPIPFLMLKNKKASLKDFVWHWFLIVGYEEKEDDFFVKTATYGEFLWLSLRDLWNTGYDEKGGMIIVNIVK